jgi:hypothetical protein
LTLFKVIVGVGALFKRKRVFTPVKTSVLALTIKALMMAIHLPSLSTFFV